MCFHIWHGSIHRPPSAPSPADLILHPEMGCAHANTHRRIYIQICGNKHPGILSINLLVYTNIMNHFNSYIHEHL